MEIGVMIEGKLLPKNDSERSSVNNGTIEYCML